MDELEAPDDAFWCSDRAARVVEHGVGRVHCPQGVGVELAAVGLSYGVAEGRGPRLHRGIVLQRPSRRLWPICSPMAYCSAGYQTHHGSDYRMAVGKRSLLVRFQSRNATWGSQPYELV